MTVSIGKVHSAGGAAAYFAADNYYTAEQSEAASAWAGEAAQDLGLSGTVETATFERILNGELPDGKQIGDGINVEHGLMAAAQLHVDLLVEVAVEYRAIPPHVHVVEAH